ncbi:MAG: hypothetical protein RL375_3040, partial [Pseudomonadota bacterium]
MHEIELKFQIAPAARETLRLALATPEARTTRLRALYYDTPDLRLATAGMALRLRLEGERWVQTFKAPGGDALRRLEHEVQLDDDAVAAGARLDVSRHANNPAGAVLDTALGDGAAALKVIFETDVSRCHRVVRHAGADIELALDVGVVRAGADELALHEIEFELVDGPVAGLLDLARLWVGRYQLWLDVRSKAERGYLLAHGMSVASATRAKAPRLRDGESPERALRRVVESCLDHILPNAAALAAGLADNDHVQQAHVGLHSLLEALVPSTVDLPAGVDGNCQEVLADLCAKVDLALVSAADRTSTPSPSQLAQSAPSVAGNRTTSDAARDNAGAAMRASSSGALWLDLLAFAHPQPQAINYPIAGVPERGRTIEVAPGVHWIRMPLPFRLDHINLWAIDDTDGWALVDTGIRTDETMQTWRALFANQTDTRSLSRVFVTHMHPDHVGMAGWLTRKFKVRLWMTRLEYLTCRVIVSDTGREAPSDGIDFYRRAGWSEAAIETYRVRFGNFGNMIHALPDSFRALHHGEEFAIGKHLWRVIVGNGHSPEHACLYCPELKLFISGDQVLPRISSNVSVYPLEPDTNPMADWLDSLARIKREVPDDVLVLPSHNECFTGLHARIEALQADQQAVMTRLRAALAEPRRAIDVFEALFKRPIGERDVHLLSMATGESLACL